MRIKPFRSSVDVGGTRLISYCRTAAPRAVIAAVTAADIGARTAAGVRRRRNDLHWMDKHLNNTFEASGQGVRPSAPVILNSSGTIRFRRLELGSEKVDFFMLTSSVEFFPPA